MIDKLRAMVDAFSASGGQELQLGVLDAAVL